MPIDVSIYVAHSVFWGAFGLTRAVLARKAPAREEAANATPAPNQAQVAPFSRVLLGVHMVAFGVMYAGIGSAVFSRRIPPGMPYQRGVGALVIGAGLLLTLWALVWFRSWRFRAKLEAGHQLATGGPFRFLRHPIYMGLNLLALGSAIWIPTWLLWAGCGLIWIGSDLRGRSEEKLLTRAFGEAYREYCTRTSRFLPGIY